MDAGVGPVLVSVWMLVRMSEGVAVGADADVCMCTGARAQLSLSFC